MSLKKVPLIALILLTISGCGEQSKPYATVRIDKPVLIVPTPPELSMRPVTWKVIAGADNYIALDTVSYENLALNMQDIRAYILNQQSIIKAYKDYYE